MIKGKGGTSVRKRMGKAGVDAEVEGGEKLRVRGNTESDREGTEGKRQTAGGGKKERGGEGEMRCQRE